MDQLLCEKNIQINRLKSLDSQTKHTLISNFYDLHRDFRNTINNIEKHHKSHSPNQTAEITTAVYRFTRDSLNYLSEIFTQLTGEQISACVKVMLADDFDKIDYNTAFVTTFARSSNTSRNRISYHESQPAYVKLSKNTDFMEVVSENRINPSSCFYQGNLREYALKLEEMNLHYSNTTEEYWRFYKGTIVAPIRIANKYLFYTPKNVGYNTIGFLCVDSESDTAFPPELEEDYTSIMRAFAAILYNVLSKYQFYLAELDRSNLQNGVDFEPIQRTSQKWQKTGGIWIRGK